MNERVWMQSIALAWMTAGCGLMGGGGGGAGATTPANAPAGGAPTSGGAAAAAAAPDAELRAMVTEALTPQLCPKLLGSYVGLPGESDARGLAAGATASVGRWWIRRCEARTVGDRMELSIGGSGWTWIDREAGGFRVRQYLLFDASASLGADVTVGYDRARRVASLWMTPAAGVQATITPRGLVNVEPQGFFASVLGGVAAATGASVSERARTQAAELGSTQLRDRLGAGFTMTVGLERRQVDFMVGALQRGEVPERPYPAAEGGPWLVNQRSMVWPGGLDVVGPVDASQAALGLDVTLEEGDGVVIRAVCAEPLTRYFDARFRDPVAVPAAPSGEALAELTQGSRERHITLPAQVAGSPCPLVLTFSTRAGSALPARMRYRIAPEVPGTVTAPSAPRRVRVQVVGVTVTPRNANGRAWDLVGGEADVRVITASVPLRREVDRTPVAADHNDATFGRWLPSAFEVGRDLPLRFTVVDDDTTTEEAIGSADLDADALARATPELSLPVRTSGAVPTQTGTLRLRIEAVP
jgi:hypothetical protein